MDGGAWWAAVHGVAKTRTRLSNFTFTFHLHALEKATATHSSVLAWRIPGTGEPGGLPFMGSRRVRHDWSDLAAYINLEKEMTTHSSIFAWRILWIEELGGLQFTGRKKSDTTERLHFHLYINYLCICIQFPSPHPTKKYAQHLYACFYYFVHGYNLSA